MRQKRAQVDDASKMGMSVRKASKLFLVSRHHLHDEDKVAKRDEPVLAEMRVLAQAHPRYGYRRVLALLRRQGKVMSSKRAYRLWVKGGLKVPSRMRRKLPRRKHAEMLTTMKNHVWAYDFVFDSAANGQVLKCLTVIDEYTRESLAIDVGGSIRSARVVEVIMRLMTVHGIPRYIRSDNGPEFIAMALKAAFASLGIMTIHNEPGKPWQNGRNESFNGKFRDECLNAEYFPSRKEALLVIEAWRVAYNERRPHSSLGYLTPDEFKEKSIKLKMTENL